MSRPSLRSVALMGFGWKRTGIPVLARAGIALLFFAVCGTFGRLRHIDFIFLRSAAFPPDDTIQRGMERKERKGLRKKVPRRLNKVTLHLATSRAAEQRSLSSGKYVREIGWGGCRRTAGEIASGLGVIPPPLRHGTKMEAIRVYFIHVWKASPIAQTDSVRPSPPSTQPIHSALTRGRASSLTSPPPKRPSRWT